MSIALYFAPTFFSPYYFPPLAPLADVLPPPSEILYRDRDAFEAIVDALESTGAFAEVVYGPLLQNTAIGADRVPLAVIAPEEWTELDDTDPTTYLRHVTFSIRLVVRGEDAENRFQSLDLLTAIVENAIDGSDLGGGCLPGLTKVRRGWFDPALHHPEQQVTLTGEFSYLIPGPAAHDTTP
jgi:hypothetical protein